MKCKMCGLVNLKVDNNIGFICPNEDCEDGVVFDEHKNTYYIDKTIRTNFIKKNKSHISKLILERDIAYDSLLKLEKDVKLIEDCADSKILELEKKLIEPNLKRLTAQLLKEITKWIRGLDNRKKKR